MSNQSRAIVLFMTIVAVLLVSAVGTTSVYADDGTPPPPPTETSVVDPSTGEGEPVATEPAEVAPPASEGDVVTEPAEVVPPTSEDVAAEATEVAPPASEGDVVTEPAEAAPPVDELPVATEPAVTEPEQAAPAEEAPVVEEQQPAEAAAEAVSILEQVPDETAVTVLNAEGEAQPLTSQESADAILTSDPVWCPGNALPGDAGCTDSFDSFSALLQYLKDHEGEEAYQQEGTIYVQMGTYVPPETETSIDFNSYNFTSLNNYNLTLQGGWNTSDNTTTSTTTLNVPIVVGTSSNPWIGSLTFNNISISDVANQTGLTLFSDGTITVSNVSVTGSLGGADLNAGGDVYVQDSNFNNNQKFGAKINSGGYVEVRNSNFNDNKSSKTDGSGLEIDNQGNTFLQAVSASRNETFGADINSGGYVAILDSVFEGNISYSNCPKIQRSCTDCKEVPNGGYGLKIVSKDEAYLDGVQANGNYLFGAHIDALYAEIYNSSFSRNGSGALNNPQGYGLEVLTTGGSGVTLDNVHADKNQLFGANITAGAAGVVISNSFFDGNKSYYDSCSSPKRTCYECAKTYYGYGLQVVTTGDGDINLSSVSASNNYLFGAHLDGGDVGISTGTFSGNSSGSSSKLTGEGLQIKSTGNVNLFSVAANNNQLFGGDILAAGTVNIVLSTFNGQQVFSGTKVVGGGYGLQVVATGEQSGINLSGVTASNNYLFGMHLVAFDVQISGNGSNYSRAENNKQGILIESTGAVSLDMVVASNNALSGATILSGLNEAFIGTVLISNSFFDGNSSYSYSPCKGKTLSGYGLKVITTGDDISLVNVEANDNYLYGAHLEGASISVSGGLFNSNGTDNLSDHVGKGLEIVSTGANETVSLNNVTASNNQLFGANIQAEGFVSVFDSVFNGNMSYYSNCGNNSRNSSGGGNIGVHGSSQTCHECTQTYDGYGLQVVTAGDIFVGNVTANGNYLYGAHLEGANVTVLDSTFSFNASPVQQGKTPTGRGLEVVSTGNTSLQGVEANNNQLFGADIEAGGNVEITSSFFNNNKYYTSYSPCKGNKSAGYGLKVVATGSISLGESGDPDSSVQALGNGAEGAILNGQSTVQVVDSLFNNNGANGLTITANGDITLTNVTATGNKGNGVEATGVCTNVVHVDGGNFADNSKYGLKVVKATYDEINPPTFSGNGSGGLFKDTSTCVSSTTGTSGTSSGGSGSGWNWWYWWWYWHHGFGH